MTAMFTNRPTWHRGRGGGGVCVGGGGRGGGWRVGSHAGADLQVLPRSRQRPYIRETMHSALNL